MTALRVLRVLTVAMALSLCLISNVTAAPFPSLTFHASAPGSTGISSTAPCDSSNDCVASFETRPVGHPRDQDITLPHFGLLGQALLTVQFSYDVQATVQAIGTNSTSGPVQVGGGFSGVDLSANILDPAGSLLFFANNFGPNEPCVGSIPITTVPPGQQIPVDTCHTELTGSLVLLPGDPLFSSFLGPADLDFRPIGSGHQHFFIIGACGANCPNVAPVLMSHTFSASFDVTYRYCTPSVDLGCPAAIVGFNSPVPEPAALLLFASGVAVVVMASAASRRRKS